MSKVWLVTGSASGLGRNIAEAVLASGDRLIATARDPRRLDDLVEKYGDHVRNAPLDVADEAAAYAAVQVAMDSVRASRYGREQCGLWRYCAVRADERGTSGRIVMPRLTGRPEVIDLSVGWYRETRVHRLDQLCRN